MADKPLAQPLTADLPENWNPGQIVAPNGVDVGLPEQYGYNYLMAAVNSARRAINTVNEGFEAISGKRTVRFVVGTSAAGWTKADCDYLCDGRDDQEEINAAIDALPESGGEIVILDGEYNFTRPIQFQKDVTFTGAPGVTVLRGITLIQGHHKGYHSRHRQHHHNAHGRDWDHHSEGLSQFYGVRFPDHHRQLHSGGHYRHPAGECGDGKAGMELCVSCGDQRQPDRRRGYAGRDSVLLEPLHGNGQRL